jgi:hypothetical protein
VRSKLWSTFSFSHPGLFFPHQPRPLSDGFPPAGEHFCPGGRWGRDSNESQSTPSLASTLVSTIKLALESWSSPGPEVTHVTCFVLGPETGGWKGAVAPAYLPFLPLPSAPLKTHTYCPSEEFPAKNLGDPVQGPFLTLPPPK